MWKNFPKVYTKNNTYCKTQFADFEIFFIFGKATRRAGKGFLGRPFANGVLGGAKSLPSLTAKGKGPTGQQYKTIPLTPAQLKQNANTLRLRKEQQSLLRKLTPGGLPKYTASSAITKQNKNNSRIVKKTQISPSGTITTNTKPPSTSTTPQLNQNTKQDTTSTPSTTTPGSPDTTQH